MASKAQWLTLVLIASLLGLAGGWLAAYQTLKAPLERLNLVTPVFVLDRAKMIQAIPPNATQAQMAKIVDDWQSQARKLSDAGYLVIDSTAVVAAPSDLYIQSQGR